MVLSDQDVHFRPIRKRIYVTICMKAMCMRRQGKPLPRLGFRNVPLRITFRHSFASLLLQANYDIRTIQELLGHSDARTTMIYTRPVQSRTLKETKSPLDF